MVGTRIPRTGAAWRSDRAPNTQECHAKTKARKLREHVSVDSTSLAIWVNLTSHAKIRSSEQLRRLRTLFEQLRRDFLDFCIAHGLFCLHCRRKKRDKAIQHTTHASTYRVVVWYASRCMSILTVDAPTSRQDTPGWASSQPVARSTILKVPFVESAILRSSAIALKSSVSTPGPPCLDFGVESPANNRVRRCTQLAATNN